MEWPITIGSFFLIFIPQSWWIYIFFILKSFFIFIFFKKPFASTSSMLWYDDLILMVLWHFVSFSYLNFVKKIFFYFFTFFKNLVLWMIGGQYLVRLFFYTNIFFQLILRTFLYIGISRITFYIFYENFSRHQKIYNRSKK